MRAAAIWANATASGAWNGSASGTDDRIFKSCSDRPKAGGRCAERIRSGTDGVDAVEWDPEPRHHSDRTERVRGEASLRSGLHKCWQTAGVVGIVVGEPDPSKVARVNDGTQSLHK